MVVLSWFRNVGWGAWWKKRVIWISWSSAAWKCTVYLWSERSSRAAEVSGFRNSAYPVQNQNMGLQYDWGHRGAFGELKAFFLLSCSCVVDWCHLRVVNQKYLLKTTNAGNRPFWKKAAASACHWTASLRQVVNPIGPQFLILTSLCSGPAPCRISVLPGH